MVGNRGRIRADNGVVFTHAVDAAIGSAWLSPTGLLWGRGTLGKMPHAQAILACEAIGGRLPTFDEFMDLSAQLSGGNVMYNLPHMFPNAGGRGNSRDFWTSTLVQNDATRAHTGDYTYGLLDSTLPVAGDGWVRCVR